MKTGEGGSEPRVGNDESTRAAVAKVVQKMAAARLARGFLPLGVIFLFGTVQMALRGPLESDYALLALGSLGAAVAALVYGNGAVRRALGTDGPGLTRAVTLLGLFPYAFALYLLGFRGLRLLSGGSGRADGPVGFVVAVVFVILAARILWDLSRLTRLHRLARTMTVPAPEER